jgi:hypothetical protein
MAVYVGSFHQSFFEESASMYACQVLHEHVCIALAYLVTCHMAHQLTQVDSRLQRRGRASKWWCQRISVSGLLHDCMGRGLCI